MPFSFLNLWRRCIRLLTVTSKSTPTYVDVATSTALTTGPFRLLDLPSELQLAIFELATVTSDILLMGLECCECEIGYSSIPCNCRRDDGFITYKFPPALARVSRSIRHDVLKIFYGQEFKVFVRFTNYERLNTWLAHVEPEYRRLIRMYIVAEGAPFVKNFVDFMVEELREAGLDPVPVRCRHHDWHFSVTFREPVVEQTAQEVHE